MRILQVIDKLNTGGAERVLVDLSNLLFEQGEKVDVLSILNHAPLDQSLHKEIKHVYLNRKSRFDLRSIRAVNNTVKQYDIIHVHSRHNLRYLIFCIGFQRFKAKIVFQDHKGIQGYHVSFFLKYCLRRVDAYVGVYQLLCDWAIKVIRVPKTRVHLLSNIVRSNSSSPIKQRPPFRLVMVGNFRPIKNYEFAIEVFSELRKYGPFTLDIYGNSSDIEYFECIQKTLEERGLSNSVRLINDVTDVQSVLKSYTLALHTAKSETGPLVLMEYLASGLPFVTFETGEVTAQLKRDIPDFILANHNTQDWVVRIQQVISSQVSGQYLNDLFSNHFSERQYLNKCLEIYRTVLHS